MAAQLSASERRLTDELCARSAEWAPGIACRPRPVAILPGGYRNRSIVLAARQRRWVLRIRRDRAAFDFASEVHNHRAAAAVDIAPALRWTDMGRGLMIMDFVPSRPGTGSVDEQNAQQAGSPASIAALLRKIHELPVQGSAIHSPLLLEEQRRVIPPGSPLGRTLCAADAALSSAADLVDRQAPRAPALCHNDLLAANRLERSDGRLLALDWEYAAPGDPFFDMAVCASQMSAEDTRALLNCYLGHSAELAERRHLFAQCLLYRCVEACWYASNSPDSAAAQRSHQQLQILLQSPPPGEQ